jgi:hypothetical protein
MAVVVQRRTKMCVHCERDLLRSKFSKSKITKDGLCSWCNQCRAIYNKQWRQKGAKPKPAYLGKMICAIEDCKNRRETRQFCSKHYSRFRKYGDPHYLAPPRPRSPLTWDQRMQLNDFDRWADMKRQAYIKRRRLLETAKQEPYSRLAVFERDGWICQLCYEPIDPTIKGRKSKAASIDHVIPLALGGDDTPDNVQAAHFGCNSGKCNRVREEVMI